MKREYLESMNGEHAKESSVHAGNAAGLGMRLLMMNTLRDRRYSDFHLWVLPEGRLSRIGISAYAAKDLRRVDHVELPEVGKHMGTDEALAVVETSKAAIELPAPIAGTVVESNVLLKESPMLLVSEPYARGWLVLMDPYYPSAITALLSAEEYEDLTV